MSLAPLNRDRDTQHASWRRSPRRSRLLDLDSDLGALLSDDRLPAARGALTVRCVELRRGAWAAAELRSASADHVGLLVVSGAMAREVALEDTISTELLGPGDLIRPWMADRGSDLLGEQVQWHVMADARVALLDRAFGIAVRDFPEVNAMLLDRLNGRLERLATMKAIAQLNTVDRRLMALFWHLAERWGRVTPEGIVVPLVLSHRLLGDLIGARRPTVSTALARLAAEGRLMRRHDGTWLVDGEAGRPPAGTQGQAVPHRRRLLREAPVEDRVGIWRSGEAAFLD